MLGFKLPLEATLDCEFRVEREGAFGLRAFCNMPSGVEDAVLEAVGCGSEMTRREGTRGVFVDSGEGLVRGEDPSDAIDIGLVGASPLVSGAFNALGSGVAMAEYELFIFVA